MKKILTLFTALLVLGSMMVVQAATSTTVYYAVPSATVGSYTVKLNVNRQGDANNWEQYTMNLSDKTYESNPIYTYTFTDLYDGLGALQFQLYDGNTWKSQVQPITSWTSASTYNGKMWVHGSNSWREYTYDGGEPIPSYTFPAGTTIYYDFRTYGSGVNLYNSDWNNEWKSDVSEIISKTLENAWEVTASSSLFRSNASNWNIVTCSTLPTEGQDMLVSTDGVNYTWGTYVPTPPTPAVYTVVGTVPGLNWDQTSSTNDMTENEGVYTLTLTDVELPVNTYEYKIVKNHAWAKAYPQEGNASFTITEAGIYDLTFTLDLLASPEYSVVPTFKQALVIVPTVKMHGTFGGEWGDTQEFVIAGNNESASLTLENLPEGNYTFKVVVGSTYHGNGHTFHRDYIGAKNIETGDDMTLEADVTGNYTFTWTYGNDSLGIEFPAEPTPEYAEIKFYAPLPWTTVHAYSYKGSRQFRGDWPGDEVTDKDGEWYVVNVRKGTNLIFADGAGMQTFDIMNVSDDACYVPTGLDKTEHEADETKPIKVTIAEQCALNYYLKNKWNGGEWTWMEMSPAEDGKYRLVNVVYGGSGINYNIMAADEGAQWKEYANIKYMEGTKAKVVTAYDTINLVLDPVHDTIWAEMVSQDLTVYTVASNSLALCDLGWAATHPYKYTDMTKQADGTYQWTKGDEEVLLPAGKVYIKVVKDRDYENGYWPTAEEGFEYTIQQSGIYKIEVNFNPCTHDITIDTTLVKTVNVKDLYIQGLGDLKTLVKDGDNYKALATISLTAGTHNFSLVDGGSNKLGNGQAFTRENNSYHEIVAESGADMTIEVDKAGEYLFTYIFEYEQLMIQYPANVPAVKIAPIGGKFTINAKGDTAVFSRGNLQYNYEADEWYTAEKQYEVLGDLNLRFGDNTYQGSIDLFGWSCESSDYGKQWKYRDEEFSGDFVDWGHLFDGGDQEWSTLSEAEWNFILARKQGNRKLWTMITLGVDSLNGLAIFPDDWSAPACASEMVYGFYDLDDAVNYQKNSFTFAEWAEMEAAGAVFFPLSGARAGFWGNNWSGTAETDLSNPLSSGYDWVDNVNWMGYYWLSTVKSATQVSTAILPGWHNNQWNAPTIWSRERRRGQPVRLVTIIPKNEFVTVRENLNENEYYTMCLEKAVAEVRGGSIWRVVSKAANASDVILEEVVLPLDAGRPYIFYATASTLEVVYTGAAVDAPVNDEANNGLVGSFVKASIAQSSDNYIIYNNELYYVNSDNVYVGANRAYLNMSAVPAYNSGAASAPGRRRITMGVHSEQTATGMDELKASETPVKVMIDGQMYILRGEKIYDATGRMIK